MHTSGRTAAAILTLLMAARASPGAEAAEGRLVAHWKLDEREGKTAGDSSGNGYHGVLHGKPVWQPEGGVVGGALRFGGRDQYVDCGTVPGSAAALTLAFWMKADSATDQIPVDKHPADKTGVGWTIKLKWGDQFRFRIGSTAKYSDLRIGSAYAAGAWVHVACTFQSGEARVYLDGMAKGSQTGIGRRVGNTTTSLHMGRPSVAYQREAFAGLLDDVRIYDRALSAAEIKALYREAVERITLSLQRLDGVLQREGLDAREAVRARRRKGELYETLGDFDSAITEYREIIGLAGDDQRLALEMTLAVCEAHLRADRVREAIGCLEEASKTKGADRRTRAEMRVRQASLWYSGLGDYEEAARVCRRALADFADVESVSREARRLLLKSDLRVAKTLLDRRDLEAAKAKYAEVRADYEELALNSRNPDELVGHLQAAYRDMCSARLGLGEYRTALVLAKRYYDVAGSAGDLEKAVRMMTQALRGIDGNLVRVNAFLRYQKSGPAGMDAKLGTPDDLLNPLADIVRVSKGAAAPRAEESREEAFLKKCLGKLGPSLDDSRGRGYVLLALGDARGALAEFKRRFIMCQTDQKQIRQAVSDVLVGLRALHGHVFAGEAFLEYQEFGSKGRDGKSNIENPLKDF